MPTFWRSSTSPRSSASTDFPATLTLPPWMGSSAFRQRRKVDLPQPEGPMITMTSPRLTSSDMSSRTTWSP